jgi:hypothetical protein
MVRPTSIDKKLTYRLNKALVNNENINVRMTTDSFAKRSSGYHVSFDTGIEFTPLIGADEIKKVDKLINKALKETFEVCEGSIKWFRTTFSELVKKIALENK